MFTPTDQAEELFRRGQTYARRDEYARAVEAFTGAIDLTPGDAALYFARGDRKSVV